MAANIAIRTHDFEVAKSEIRRMASNTPREVTFSKVETDGGLFGWFNHDVTGAELNKHISEVSKQIRRINQSTLQIHEALLQAYNAFEALDKDYIKYILQNLEATKTAANTANQTANALTTTIQKVKEKIADSERRTQVEIDSIKNILHNLDSTRTVANTAAQTANNLTTDLQNIKERMAETERRTQMDIDNIKRNATGSSSQPVLLYVISSLSLAFSIAALIVALIR